MSSTPTVQRQLLAALQDGPATVTELCEALPHLTRASLHMAAHYAHRCGLVRIDTWQRSVSTGGRPAPAWAIADGAPDAPRPRIDRRHARAEGMRRYRERNQARLALTAAARRGEQITPLGAMVHMLACSGRRVAR